MYLKRLELSGFKSFAQKNTLEFPRGISVIVGPNGSGKSNLSDAIRWALGEQSMKTIRTAKAEELIFAGTPQKAAAGLAQVSVFLDNSDKFFPSDSSEISLSRKLYRSGESEYFLNRETVRLKDIVAFLAKARLGVHGFCVVSQGAADALLAAPSREKREIIEEALGLKEFQLKKNEAKKKIEDTKINLDKVSSMIQEIAPHLRYLKRQVNKFEKRAGLEEELKKLQKIFFGRELLNFLADSKNSDRERARISEKFQKETEVLRQIEENLGKEEGKTPQYFQEFEAIEEKIGRLQGEKNNLLREFGKIEGLIEAEKGRVTVPRAAELPTVSFSAVVGQLKKIRQILEELLGYESIDEIKSKIREISTAIEATLNPERPKSGPAPAEAENAGPMSDFQKQKETTKANLDAIDREINELNRRFQEIREKNKQEMAASAELVRLAEKKKNELREAENVLRNMELAEAKFKIKEDDLKSKIREAQLGYEEIAELAQAIESGRVDTDQAALLATDPVMLEEKIFRIRRELGEIGAIDEELLREYRETDTRHGFLVSQSEDLVKATGTLNGMILELEDKINTEFNEALTKINQAFNQYFQLMFGGGSAKLFKTAAQAESGEDGQPASPPEEVLEIKIDMPRKKIKSLDMLSGGERTLTSIALLFGIIATSPPPFLILDEIDAALDEANSLKFARLLKDLSGETQFILITHNRQTMSQANVLYGVTMGNEGISRLLSLKLEEAEEIGRQYKEKPVAVDK